ncbi:MAG: SDR family NAD(P)-dependent oxidoreductase [Oleibacter sp.]|nr:SDR family NAD(P)-dependent oxidoreductase [Thalassolituus sp.]
MKTAVVTGGSSGIGKETTKALVSMGYRVIIAARNQAKGIALIETIQQDIPSANIEFHSVDLSDFSAVKQFCRYLKETLDSLELLVLNAGLFTSKLETNSTGHELMFASTHLGHFLMTHELMPLMRETMKKASSSNPYPVRIVVTSSVAHQFASFGNFFKTLENPIKNNTFLLIPFINYGRSKLANLLFVRGLASRLKDEAILVNGFHPGGVKSDIWRGTPSLFNRIIYPFLVTEKAGAETQIFLATEPKLNESGQYFCRKKKDFTSPRSRNKKLIDDLWTYSENALNIDSFGLPD